MLTLFSSAEAAKGTSMRTGDIRLLYAYNHWANTRILDTAERVPAELFATARLGACQLKEVLTHILAAESAWRLRWQGIAPESAAFPEDFASLQDLRRQWDQEQRALDAYLAALADTDLDQLVTYRRWNGETASGTLWHLLVHVANHSAQHRSELALLLTELGCSPGDLDLTVFLRQRS
jgi:uncharacterized damage-inducible protein DinB